jgi:hypothetical protein
MKVGDFTVELVAADTKQPFKEHMSPDGQFYAEVEPDVDYFIALRSDVGGVKMSFAVDGLSLGYSSNFTTSTKSAVYKGSWERKGCGGSQEVTRALRFSKTRQEVGVKPNTLTGKIEVTVSKLGEQYYKDATDFTSAELTANSTLGGKKCVKTTTVGSRNSLARTPTNRTTDNKIIRYKKGKHLCTITLNYCSAFGLIYNKILPPPPDYHTEEGGGSVQVKREKLVKKEKRRPLHAAGMDNIPALKAKKKKEQKVTNHRSFDMIDLTADDGSL